MGRGWVVMKRIQITCMYGKRSLWIFSIVDLHWILLSLDQSLLSGETCRQKSLAHHQDAKMVNWRRVLNNFSCRCHYFHILNAGNILEHAWGRTAPNWSVRKRPEAHARTCSYTVRLQSDGCRSIKVSIVLPVLSVDSFFAVSVASITYRGICASN